MGSSASQRSQAHGTIAHDLDGKLSARRPPKLLADGLGNDDLTLAGHTGCGLHEVYQTRVKALVDSVITEAALERSRTGRPVEGVESILARNPQYRPAKLARSPAARAYRDEGGAESLL